MKSFNSFLFALVMLGGVLVTSKDQDLSAQGVFSIPLINRNMEEYYAEIRVGTIDRPFKIVFDTAMDVKIIFKE